jgi:hypothetical protein
MATYYIKQRLKGPVGIITVQANTRAAAIAILSQSAAAGTEYEIWDAAPDLAITGTTGPTSPTGMTGLMFSPTVVTGPTGQ